MSGRCTCGAEIVWAVMESGKRMPFEPEPTLPAPGLYRIENGKAFRPELHLTHYANCPDATKHRRGRGGET